MNALDDLSLDTLFRQARSHNRWLPQPVPRQTLEALYELFKWGPTSNNACPARLGFVTSTEGKEKLRPALAGSNLEKAMSAPVVAIIAMDTQFQEQLPTLFPAYDARASMLAMPEDARRYLALLNTGLQGGYLIMAARALGLDCGPMGGFDKRSVDEAFFPDGQWHSTLLCALGMGDVNHLRPRGPRLKMEAVCRFY